jgi:hypothetical protein
MTTMWQAPAVVVVFMWLNGPADTLDRAARRDALRRSMMPQSVASLSIYDWPPTTSSPGSPSAPPSPVSPAYDIGAASRGVTVETAAAPGESGRRDEAWWRSRITTARAALERDQTLADAMQSHVNALQTDVVNRDDPAQQAALRQRLTTALAELERLKAQIVADRQAILDIEDEARRLNVPAGWIRREDSIS